MPKHTDIGPPPKIEFRKNGIYSISPSDREARIADPILVTAFADEMDGGQAFTKIKFLTRSKKWKSEMMPPSLLVNNCQEFIAKLSNRGYMWPPASKLRAQIVGALSTIRPKNHIRITYVPGWHGQLFVLPLESYSPTGPDRKGAKVIKKNTVKLGEFGRSGTLDGWRKYVAIPCLHSSRGVLLVSAAFAAVNLRTLGLSSCGINLSGTTSRGKTTLLRCAASVCGLNSNAGPATWDASATGLEQRALGHRDCIVPLDDLSYLQGDPKEMAKLVTFRLSGNRAKSKAGEYSAAQDLVESDYRVIGLSTSEHPIWGQTNGVRSPRGEEVRMIDVPACISSMEDVFDGPEVVRVVGNSIDDRRKFAEALERRAQKYQGEAFRAYLMNRVPDQTARSVLKRYMSEYEKSCPLPSQQAWLGRVRKIFAVVYASAAQAIDYGILPWTKEMTINSIKTCMDDAMQKMVPSESKPECCGKAESKSDHSLLSDFRDKVNKGSFVHLVQARQNGRNASKELRNADGIVRRGRRGRVQYLLYSKVLKQWYPDFNARRRLVSLTRSHGIFRNGRRPDTTTRQIFVAEFRQKVPCYVLSRKRLEATINLAPKKSLRT